MRALLSVSDKTGIIELAAYLSDAGYELISSGGTYNHLKQAGLSVRQVSDVTGVSEFLGGRVKTLHPSIHGGILARRGSTQDMTELAQLGIQAIDLVVVDLYPFSAGLTRGLPLEEQVELIDIGGPTMLRAAAKNFPDVIVLSHPEQYGEFIERSKIKKLDPAYRKQLAGQVFSLMAAYDSAVANYLSDSDEYMTLHFQKVQQLRYGENPHQAATFYRDLSNQGSMSDFELLGGKPLSYCNLADIDTAYAVVMDFAQTCVCAIKHDTPCGVAIGETVLEAYEKTYQADPVSIFGAIVASNKAVDRQTAEKMVEIFLEVIVAPDFTREALEVLSSKPNLRIVRIHTKPNRAPLLKSVNGGLLVQQSDMEFSDRLETVTKQPVAEQELRDLVFAMTVAKHVKSNAIVVAKNGQTLGIGGGQTNRIDAARLALRGAVAGAVLASDGFFPFDDVVRAAHEAGIRAILQPGGSLRDNESIQACDDLGIAMVLTGRRHFRH